MPIHYATRESWLLLAVLVGACGDHPTDIDRPPRDLVRSAEAAPTIGLGPDKTFSLPSSSEGPREFIDLRGVLIAQDGSIAVADAGVPSVFVFTVTGELIAAIGRAGSGPGEFREPILVAFWGDSLAVFDPPQRRLSYFRTDGSLIRQRPVAVPGTMSFSIAGIRKDGALIFKGTVLEAPPGGSALQRLEAVVLAIDTRDRIDTLVMIDDGPWLPNGPLWYAWRSAVAVTDAGIWYGNGGRPELSFLRWNGAVGPPLRWTGLTRAVDDHDREVITEIAGSHKASPALTAPDRFADSIPYFGRLLSDPTGGVWVIGSSAPFAVPDSAWFVDPASGTIDGVALPTGFRPTEIDLSSILGVTVDADGIPNLTRFRLDRR